MARVGMAEIAERCGVSSMTVSRVLAGKSELHKDETVDLVQEVARQMGYSPNLVAKSMQSGRTGMIGVILRPSHGSWFSDLQCGIHDHLLARGFLPLTLAMTDDAGRNDAMLHEMLGRRVEGLVVWLPHDEVLEECRRSRLPVVMVDTTHPRAASFDFVGTDDRAGGRLAAEHLIELGHRHTAVIALRDLSSMRNRSSAFVAAMESESGAACRSCFVEVSGGEETCAVIRDVLASSSRPTAIFAGNDSIAWAVIHEARAMGIVVPRDLSVVGYADLDFAEMITPALTTVRQAPETIGQRAADVLLDSIEAKRKNRKPQRILLKPELVVRESTAAVLQ